MFPKVEINLDKLSYNVKAVCEECNRYNINVWGVTKCFCGMPELAEVMVQGGVTMLADSRIENLKKMKDICIPKVLLRIPMASQVPDVIEYADYSLNSEIATLELLGIAAKYKSKTHKVILMIDLGDLREGILTDDVYKFVEEAINIKGIEIKGFGVNLTCYGGVVPDEQNLTQLANISREMIEKFNLNIEIISGGNSSSFYMVRDKKMVNGINNLRIGELILLGRETAFGNRIEPLYNDAFVLKGQLVEVKSKPSVPFGIRGMDAFGNIPEFRDKGIIRRGIVAFGKQDIDLNGIFPLDKGIEVLGGSSDHTIINLSSSDKNYKVGDIVEFLISYGCLLRIMTSEYVHKEII